MSDRRIVLLDIDGVVNSSESRMAGRVTIVDGRRIPIDPQAVARLNRLVQPGVEFVLSSTWRHYGTARVQAMLATAGFVGELIDCTPLAVYDRTESGRPFAQQCRGINATRGQEIAAWLDANFAWDAEIAILDDDDDMDPVREWLVQTDFDVGLVDADVEQAARLLGLS